LSNGSGRLSWFARAKYVVVRGFLYGIVKLFGLRGLYRFGQFFGTCEFLINYKRRKRISRRMDQIYNPPIDRRQKRRIARKQITRIRCDKMLYTIVDKLDRQVLLQRIRKQGWEHFDAALERGKGMFLLFSHHGSHHLAGILLTLMGYKITGVRDPHEGVLRQYFQEKFDKSFPEFSKLNIAFSGDFAKPFFKALRSNGIVAAALDVWRDRGRNVRTIEVKVFGQRREFVSGMAQIALRCKAAIVVGFMLSEKDYYYRMIVHPWVIDPDTAEDTAETLQTVMQRYAELIEQHVRKYPWNISKTK